MVSSHDVISDSKLSKEVAVDLEEIQRKKKEEDEK